MLARGRVDRARPRSDDVGIGRFSSLAGICAAALVAGGIAASGLAGPAVSPGTRTIVGTSLDWRDVASGEQLLVARGGVVIDAVGDEHSPFTVGSQLGFLARPVPCIPKSAHSCFVMGSFLGLYTFQPPRTHLTIRAVLVSESTNSLTVSALASPAGQPRLLFTFAASARTLASAQVHVGGLVELRLARVSGGARGPEADWSHYSWTATSLRAV
jgi:hypothetical protein